MRITACYRILEKGIVLYCNYGRYCNYGKVFSLLVASHFLLREIKGELTRNIMHNRALGELKKRGCDQI